MCFAPLQDMHNGRVIVSANFDLCVAFRPIKPHLVRYNWHDSSSTVAYMVIGIPGCSLISSVQHFQRKLSTKSTPSKYRTPSTNTRIRYTQYTLMYGMPPILYCTHYIVRGVYVLIIVKPMESFSSFTTVHTRYILLLPPWYNWHQNSSELWTCPWLTTQAMNNGCRPYWRGHETPDEMLNETIGSFQNPQTTKRDLMQAYSRSCMFSQYPKLILVCIMRS